MSLKDISYLELWQPLCLVEQKHLCNFGRKVGHPEHEKNSDGIFGYILASMLKVYLDMFKKDRGGCQVWKCPNDPELGQRSTECKFLYICQILAC